MTADALLARLQASGISVRAEGGNLHISPKEAVTPETLELIRAHKAELLEAVQAEPSPEDKDFFREVLPGARIAKFAGENSEDRKARVLAQLNDPTIKRAMAISPNGMVTVGVRLDGGIWTADLRIPAEKFDPWLILERFEKATLQ